MFVIRPARAGDLAGVKRLASRAGVGLTTLPDDIDRLRLKLAAAEQAFAASGVPDGNSQFLFVLEDLAAQRVVGTAGIVSAVGLEDAFYNYRLGTTVYASRELGVYNPVETLYLSNDLTGSSELGTLFLDPDFRQGGLGALLSKSRFLFMRAHRERFATRVIAELRGVADERGLSPFWEGLGRRFFSMDFSTADALSATEMRSFIAELMPRHPLDTILLPEAVRAVIGEVHAQTRPARAMLEAEGFRYRGYVDIFDAGPALEAERDTIRSLRKARDAELRIGSPPDDARSMLVAAGALDGFRCVLTRGVLANGELCISAEAAAALEIGAGDALACLLPTRPTSGHAR